jgi:hypothetical protein
MNSEARTDSGGTQHTLAKAQVRRKRWIASSIGSYESLRRGKNTAGLAEEATKCSKEAERTAGSEKA